MPLNVKNPIYRIETPRTVIRCYNPLDAPLLEKSIQDSVDHLKPWMPWAHAEPEPLHAKVSRLRHMRAQFDLDNEYIFGIFNPEENILIGGCGLHPRTGPKSIEIGYWINVNYINQGYATEIAGALTKIAIQLYKFHRVEIHCDPKNIRSAAVPRKLNFIHEATLKDRVLNERGEFRDAMIWSITSTEYNQSKAKETKIVVYNVLNEKQKL